MTKNMTLSRAVALVSQADRLFDKAAKTWERGCNSGNSSEMKKAVAKQGDIHQEAEALLKPFGIRCTYPGLYPCFHVKGYQEHSTLNALSVALDKNTKAVKS